jgi:chromosome segregation ATPase
MLRSIQNLGAQAAADASAVDKVTLALLGRDEALWKVREDLVAMQAVAAEWETELASARAQIQQDCATLEAAWSWQSQAEEKAKEAEQLRADLADNVASLAVMEEKLQQERKLGSSRSGLPLSLEEARATLECERMARDEAQGQLQRERAALEKAQATLKLRDEEVTRLNRELAQLSVSYEDQCQAGEEKDAMILDLQQVAEAAHAALETGKK